jgi:hypothetical protein
VITGPDDVTGAVLSEIVRANNSRTQELLTAAVKHLNAFVRETNLTEAEFQHIARIIAKLGRLSNESGTISDTRAQATPAAVAVRRGCRGSQAT